MNTPVHRTHTTGTLDVVIPFYNESSSLPVLFTTMKEIFTAERLREVGLTAYQLILVNDGSVDDSSTIVKEHIQNGHPAVMINLSRNFGQQAAISAGLDHATNDVVGFIDADLQDPPQVLYEMLLKWKKGYDVVYGVRQARKESLPLKLCYSLFYHIIHLLSQGTIPRHAGDFGIIDKKVAQKIRELPEKIRFFRAMRAWIGFKHIDHTYERPPRKHGVPQYNFKKLYQLATDGIITSSTRPLRIAQILAILSSLAMLGCMVACAVRLCFLSPPPSEELWIMYTILVVLSMMAAGIFICLYTISAYLGRMFIEVKSRPPYIIADKIGFNEDSA